MRHRFSLPLLAAGLSLTGGAALAGPIFTNENGGRVWGYGQLNPAWLSVDDGAATTSELDDNTASNSRVGFWYEQAFANGTELSFNVETALGFRSTSGLSQLNEGDRSWMDWQRTDIRKIDLRLRSDYGSVFVGQGSMASDGAGQVDFSGTVLTNYVSVTDITGRIQLRDDQGALTGIPFSDAYASYDGGRYGRFRYQTPDFGGFTASAAIGQDILSENADADIWDVALRYEGDIGPLRIGAGLGYQSLHRPDRPDRNDVFASASAEHGSGVTVTAAMGNRDTDGSFSYAKLGYKGDWLPIGQTALAVDYYHGSDMALTNGATRSESDAWGVGLVQTVEDWDLETYLGYRIYGFEDNSPTTYQDASSVILGARWRF
ncbi:porin [Marinibacterium profundimaris]|uniref:Porin domain-containing protein n=1 Tax=Marinibacterium profundimaris TaxID=1679460 RepID=A0A225NRV1_9RHOB|nr:porin [Marinibacterium profundimaris]OWU77539.1 hypothetical protein ATO3_02255 [Marinibacterium profundimaris]